MKRVDTNVETGKLQEMLEWLENELEIDGITPPDSGDFPEKFAEELTAQVCDYVMHMASITDVDWADLYEVISSAMAEWLEVAYTAAIQMEEVSDYFSVIAEAMA